MAQPGRRESATTVDVSAGGGFLASLAATAPGALLRVDMAKPRPQLPKASFVARAVRVVRNPAPPNPLQGFGVQWMAVATPAGRAGLEKLLDTLGIDPAEHAAECFVTDPGREALFLVDPNELGVVEGVLSGRWPDAGSRSRWVPANHHRRRSVDRLGGLPPIPAELELSYIYDAVPYNASIGELNPRFAVIGCRHAPPPLGSRVLCRLPLVGPYSSHWVRIHGRVASIHNKPVRWPYAFVMTFERIDEFGQSGVFGEFLRYIHHSRFQAPA